MSFALYEVYVACAMARNSSFWRPYSTTGSRTSALVQCTRIWVGAFVIAKWICNGSVDPLAKRTKGDVASTTPSALTNLNCHEQRMLTIGPNTTVPSDAPCVDRESIGSRT